MKNKYRVLQPMGSGGFGKTFELVADDNTRMVLKVLYRSHPKAVSLFQQEAKVLSRLQHSGIPYVPADGYFVYWPHESEEPLHCLMMEKIEGLNLKEWLTRRNNEPISNEEGIDWMRQLVTILGEVHQLHYFHRDIKPHNIMRRNEGQLVLIDFGTAREVTGTYLNKVGGGQNVTEIISAGYTPPEQINGKAVPQSDFYALGRTFVYLLTGKRPTEFPENPRTGKMLWREGAPQVSSEFADIIDYLMAPFPGNRPQSAKAILKMLDEVEGEAPEGDTGLWPFRKKKSDSDSRAAGRPTTRPPLAASHSALGESGFRSNSTGGRKRAPLSLPSIELPNLKWPLVAAGGIAGVLFLTQIYGLGRFGIFPVNPIAAIASFPDGFLLERTLDRNMGYVNALAVAPDNQTIATGSYGSIKLWNLDTGKLLDTMTDHTQWVSAIVISNDGQILVSGSQDATIKLWNLPQRSRRLTLDGGGEVNALALSPDNRTLVSGGSDSALRVWDFPSGNLRTLLTGHQGSVESLAIAPDNRFLVSGGGQGDATVRIWDLQQGVRLRTLEGHSGAVSALAISPDGTLLASGSSDNTIRLWNLETGEHLGTLTGMDSWVRTLTFSPNGDYLIAGGDRIATWDFQGDRPDGSFSGHDRFITSLETIGEKKLLLSGSNDRSLKVWRVP